MEITKEQFDKFIKLQKSGVINMSDIVKGAKLINEPEYIYENILFNYGEIRKKYYPDIVNNKFNW